MMMMSNCCSSYSIYKGIFQIFNWNKHWTQDMIEKKILLGTCLTHQMTAIWIFNYFTVFLIIFYIFLLS